MLQFDIIGNVSTVTTNVMDLVNIMDMVRPCYYKYGFISFFKVAGMERKQSLLHEPHRVNSVSNGRSRDQWSHYVIAS